MPDLKVPYLCQLQNTLAPYGTCNVTSVAMVLGYYGYPTAPDALTQACEDRGLDRHSEHVMKQLLEEQGLRDDLRYNWTIPQLLLELKAGHPVIIHGYFTESGHIIVLRGFEDNSYFRVNDPYGEHFHTGYDTSKSGENLLYSFGLIRETCQDATGIMAHVVKPGK